MAPEFKQPAKRTHPDGVHRDYWSRPIYYMPNDPEATTKCDLCRTHVPGRPFTRMTRFLGVMSERFALEKHSKRMVAKGLAIKEHLVLQASNALNDDPDLEKSALDKVVKEAEAAAGASDKADQGTQLHETLEKILRGGKPRVPATYKADIEALWAKLQQHGLKAGDGDFEVNVVIDGVKTSVTAYGIGGRFDLLLTLPHPCPTCGCSKRVSDFKTGQVWYHGCPDDKPCGKPGFECPKKRCFSADEFAMQLAGYAMGQRYDAATGERHPMNDVCQCTGYVIHIPATTGHCEIYPVDLERGRAGLAVAYDIWEHRLGEPQLDALTIPKPVPDVETSTEVLGDDGDGKAPDIHGLIDLAADAENVRGLYRYFRRTGDWTDQHTEHATRRVAEMEAS